MYTLFRLLPVKQLAYEQAPALALAWLIAELFYKFHSFTLELAAFLATWFVFDVAIQRLSSRFTKSSALLPSLSDEARAGSSEVTPLTKR
jgi:hypothetical protein